MSMCFTIVFEGDITKLPFNPLKTETIYGKPTACGMGDALADPDDEIDGLKGALIEAMAELIYLHQHGKDGAVWWANDSKHVWRGKAVASLAAAI